MLGLKQGLTLEEGSKHTSQKVRWKEGKTYDEFKSKIFTGEDREEALLLHDGVEKFVFYHLAPVRELHPSRKQLGVAILPSPPRLLSNGL